jgi:hypothetical protein
MRALSLIFMLPMFAAVAANAEPGIQVEYFSGVPQITLEGNYSASRYTVLRASTRSGHYQAITAVNLLCVSTCFVDDRTAVPGTTYWYRFDIMPTQGAPVSYGPYSVTIAAPYSGALHARVYPNPSARAARIEVYLRGAPAEAPLEARATLLDLQGRRVRALFQGTLPRGLTTIAWDGRDDSGIELPAGQYFLRLVTPFGTTFQRLIRAR